MVSVPKDYEELFELNGEQIKTIVTSSAKEIENQLSCFLRPSNNHQTKVIGFDVEWILFRSYDDKVKDGVYTRSRCATIQLCDGQTCLIIQLRHSRDPYDLSYEFQTLHNFLSQPNITFVGVGIKDNLAKMENQYGILCKNAVELGPLAATAMRIPRLSYCGVDKLAFLVNKIDLREHTRDRPVTTAYNYPNILSKELAKLATVNVYSYFKIGSTLLHTGLDTSLVRLW